MRIKRFFYFVGTKPAIISLRMHGTENLKDTIFVKNFQAFNFCLSISALKLKFSEIFVKEGELEEYYNIVQNFSSVRFFSPNRNFWTNFTILLDYIVEA